MVIFPGCGCCECGCACCGCVSMDPSRMRFAIATNYNGLFTNPRAKTVNMSLPGSQPFSFPNTGIDTSSSPPSWFQFTRPENDCVHYSQNYAGLVIAGGRLSLWMMADWPSSFPGVIKLYARIASGLSRVALWAADYEKEASECPNMTASSLSFGNSDIVRSWEATGTDFSSPVVTTGGTIDLWDCISAP